MTGWYWVCNGGPNGKLVGSDAKSLGAAIGRMEAAMKALGATEGLVRRKTGTLKDHVPVEVETDAGDTVGDIEP